MRGAKISLNGLCGRSIATQPHHQPDGQVFRAQAAFEKSFGIIASLSEEQSAVELKSGNESSGGDLNGYYEVTDGENTTHYYIDIYKHYEHMSPSKHRIVRSYRTLYVETFYYTEFEVLE